MLTRGNPSAKGTKGGADRQTELPDQNSIREEHEATSKGTPPRKKKTMR